jgi:Trk K+ transport system NAD-binding subunit
MTVLHPRDARCVSGLRSRGITLLEVKIPPLSAFINQSVTQMCMQWPIDTRLLCVARGNLTLLDLNDTTFMEGDVLYLMCRDVKRVRQVLGLDR